MKKVLAIILSLVMALSLMACGASAPQDDAAADGDAPVVTDGATLGEGARSFTLEIADLDGNVVTATINTDEDTVGGALSKLDIIQGEESDFGLYIKTVNGVTADYDVDQTYWAFYIDGEYGQTGVDMTAITDGSVYKLAVEKAQ